MQNSLIEEPKRIPKFKNQKGVFWLDGVKIHWTLKDSYCDMYHFDFDSYCKDNENLRHTEYKYEWKKDEDEGSGRVPNLLTETGYRSYFATDLEFYDSIEEHLIEYVKYELSRDKMGKPKKKIPEYRLEFKDTGFTPKKQFTLIEMKGGNK